MTTWPPQDSSQSQNASGSDGWVHIGVNIQCKHKDEPGQDGLFLVNMLRLSFGWTDEDPEVYLDIPIFGQTPKTEAQKKADRKRKKGGTRNLGDISLAVIARIKETIKLAQNLHPEIADKLGAIDVQHNGKEEFEGAWIRLSIEGASHIDVGRTHKKVNIVVVSPHPPIGVKKLTGVLKAAPDPMPPWPGDGPETKRKFGKAWRKYGPKPVMAPWGPDKEKQPWKKPKNATKEPNRWKEGIRRPSKPTKKTPPSPGEAAVYLIWGIDWRAPKKRKKKPKSGSGGGGDTGKRDHIFMPPRYNEVRRDSAIDLVLGTIGPWGIVERNARLPEVAGLVEYQSAFRRLGFAAELIGKNLVISKDPDNQQIAYFAWCSNGDESVGWEKENEIFGIAMHFALSTTKNEHVDYMGWKTNENLRRVFKLGRSPVDGDVLSMPSTSSSKVDRGGTLFGKPGEPSD